MTCVACMGGWCPRRDGCRLYHSAGTVIVERLCEAGKLDSFEPIRIVRQPGSWERPGVGLLAPASWVDSAIH